MNCDHERTELNTTGSIRLIAGELIDDTATAITEPTTLELSVDEADDKIWGRLAMMEEQNTRSII